MGGLQLQFITARSRILYRSMILDEVEVIGNRMQDCDFKNLKRGYSGLVVTKVAADMTDNEAVQEADRA